MPVRSASEWDAFLAQFPEAHILQTSAWGELKAGFGWYPIRISVEKVGAQVLFRRLPLGFTIAYIPKGPLGSSWQILWSELNQLCRHNRAVFLLVEPDRWEPPDVELTTTMQEFGSLAPPVQPRRSLIVDLSGSEEQVLERMKQKTRYNIHLAQRKGISVRASDNVTDFYRLMQQTGRRDGFSVHSLDYYRKCYDLFSNSGKCILLQAEYDRHALAVLMAFYSGHRAWYFYGASSDEERNRMPTYLLQWEAMRWARQRGCLEYDLWGIPDEDESMLETNFAERSEGLWGVYRFKRGFGGRLVRSVGAWERVYNPILYQVYRWRMGKMSLGG
jgi:peptidoglycan pentaglycine glycine transferase (the first glycine)